MLRSNIIIKYLTFITLSILLISCSLSNRQHYQGYVEGDNIYLASPNAGVLKHLLVRRGEWVHRGQLLFQLDSNPEALILKQRQEDLLQAQRTLSDLKNPRRAPEIDAIIAQINEAEAQVKLAALRLDRMQKLYVKQAIDRDSVDAALATYEEKQQLKAQYEANLKLAKLGSRKEQIKAQEEQVASSTAKVSEALWQLDQKHLAAPADGFILDTYYREGEFVSAQQPVLALLPPPNIHIEFFIPLKALSSIHLGQKITFNCDGCTKDNEGTINYISPEAQYIPPLVYSRDNSDKLVFRIKALIKQPQAFKPGQPVVVTIL